MRQRESSIQAAETPWNTNIGSEAYWKRKFGDWCARRGIPEHDQITTHTRKLRGAALRSSKSK